MTYILELENKEDLPLIQNFLKKIKGAKLTDNEKTNDLENDVPDYIYEALDHYADSVKEEDCISKEAFFENARKKVCELYSQK